MLYLQVGPTRGVIPLVDADIQSSGAKAASCAQLASLASSSTKGSLGSLQDNPLVIMLFFVAVAEIFVLFNEHQMIYLKMNISLNVLAPLLKQTLKLGLSW